MSKSKISVIMPVYNAEKYLDESINSIINQTFKDFEFVIINDGSDDSSLKIIKGYMKNDSRIKLINNSKNLRLQKTLNIGLKASRGDYIARMDADDISLPKRLETQYGYLEKHPEIFLIGASAIVIDEKGNRLGIFQKYDDYKKIKKKLSKTNCIIHPSIMFRNEGKLFYRGKFKASEDYDLYLRLLTSDRRITNLPLFLIKYRITEGSFVFTKENQDFYFKKAQEFYKQRINFGKDDYKELSPPQQRISPSDFKKNFLKLKIFVQLLDGQSKNVRKNIMLFFKKYGLDTRLFGYFFLSLFPVKLIHLLMEKLY